MEMDEIRVDRQELDRFCQAVFQALGVSPDDSRVAAEVLVTADAYGIPSHGVGRLWRYVNGLKTRLMLPDATGEVLMDTPTSLVLDAQGALGAPVSARAMRQVIQKAQSTGAAFGCVKNSNHFGIAGYTPGWRFRRICWGLP